MNIRKAGWILALLAIVSFGEYSLSQTHNISGNKVVSPAWGGTVPLRKPIAIIAQFQNRGSAIFEPSVRLVAVINHSLNGTEFYRDTMVVTNWLSGEFRDVRFRDFTPMVEALCHLYVVAQLAGDEKPSDNSTSHTFSTTRESDIRAVCVVYPINDAMVLAGTPMQVQARFSNTGIHDQTNVKVRVQLRSCSDTLVRFQTDTTIAQLNRNDSITLSFPFKSEQFDIRTLEEGCYEIAVLSLLPDDINLANDTARSQLTLTPLSNNIKVDSILYPKPGSFHIPGDTIACAVRFKNGGVTGQSNVRFLYTAYDPDGVLVASDMHTSHWPSGKTQVLNFKSFVIAKEGYYTIKAYAAQATDENRVDDTALIRIYTGPPNDIQMVSVVSPKHEQKKHIGKPLQMAIRCKAGPGETKTYDVPVRVTVSRRFETTPVFTRDAAIKGLRVDSAERLFIFQDIPGNTSLADLAVGHYIITFELRLGIDRRHSNNVMSVLLRVIDTTVSDNIVAVKSISPPDNSIIPDPSPPIDLTFLFRNPGKTDHYKVPVIVIVVNQRSYAVYRDTVFQDFKSGDEHLISFSPLEIPYFSGLGWHNLYVASHLPNDIAPTDDAISLRFAKGYKRDVRVVAATMPADSAVVEYRTPFQPSALVEYVGLDKLEPSVPINVRILSCATNELVYTADGVTPKVTPLGIEHRFPFTSEGVSTQDFPPGCYKMIVTALDSLDNNLSNDQIYSRFSIEEPVSAVDAQGNGVLLLDQAYPNPTADGVTLGFTLPEEGIVSIRITDILGNEHEALARTYYTAGRHSVELDLSHLHNGNYLYELTFTGQNGLVERIAKTLAIVR